MTGKLLVVTYHYVRETGGIYPGIHPVSASELGEQIRRLKERFHAASPEEVDSFIKFGQPLAKDSFFITFDDGLLDHYVSAGRVLVENGIRGAFFISTMPLIEKRSPAVHKIHWLRAHMHPVDFLKGVQKRLPGKWGDMRLAEVDQKRASEMHIHDSPDVQALKFALNFLIPYDVVNKAVTSLLRSVGIREADFVEHLFMCGDNIKELDKIGHKIGLHGHSHVPLTSLDEDDALLDVRKCRDELEKLTGKKKTWLSYPYGRPDAIPERAKRFCESAEVEIAFSLISGFNAFGCNQSIVKRITPNELKHYMGNV